MAEGGWKGKSRGGKTGYSIFIYLIRHAGLFPAYFLLVFVAAYFVPASPSSTKDIWNYARKILKYGRLRSACFVYKSYYSFGQSIIDKFAISSGLQDKYTYEFEGEDVLDEVFSSGKGAIILCAHFGNWAAGEGFFKAHKTRLNFVMFDNEHAEIKEVMEKNNDPDASFKIIPVNKDSLAHVFLITEAIDRGELVCFMGDRYVHDTKLLEHDFMGHEAKFPSGPFLLASKLGVPVLFYWSIREYGKRFRFKFTKADTVSSRRGGDMELLNQYAASLEKEVRLHPEQWYNYYDFWNLR